MCIIYVLSYNPESKLSNKILETTRVALDQRSQEKKKKISYYSMSYLEEKAREIFSIPI